MTNKTSLRIGIAAFALISSPAMAQTASAPADGTDSSEIVVTAQRRSEKLSDVPASITALSADALSAASVTASTDLAKVTPGLTMQFYGSFLQPALRGVTSGGANVGEASNVATYIDGVYQPQQLATLLELPDVEQVEVLKGPQGALYGQNATGGAILVNSYAPSFTASGKFSASYGNFNAINLRGFVTAPVNDSLAFSLAGGLHNRDGFRRQVITGQRDKGLDSKAIRGKVLIKPSESAKFTLTAYYTDRSDSAANSEFAINGNSQGYFYVPSAPQVTSTKQFANDPGVYTRVKSWGTNLKSEIDLGAGLLTNVTAYFKNKADYVSDIDASPVQLAEAYTPSMTGHYVITDTNFASNKMGPLQFLVGMFYMKGSETFNFNGFRMFDSSVLPAPKVQTFDLRTFQKLSKRIVAGYGEVTFQPTDQFYITAGGRYTEESQRGFTDFAGPTVIEFPGGTVKFKEFTPRVTARYQLDSGTNIYASWGKGFKSGGINLADFTKAPFKPEKITSYEVGLKGRLLDGLHLNMAGFIYDYKNLQLVQYAPPVYFEENAAAAKIKGFDFDFNWDLTPELTLSAGGTYLDAAYRNTGSQIALATVFVPDTVNGGNAAISNTPIAGKRLIRAPKFTGNVALDYAAETGAGKLGAHAGLYYNSGYSFEASGRIRQSAYATADAELSFAPNALPGVRMVVWGKNLSNKAYLAALLQSNFADGGSYAEPRTFGIRGEYKF